MGDQIAYVQEDKYSDEERLQKAALLLEDATEAVNRARAMDATGERAVHEREQALEAALDVSVSASRDIKRVHRYYQSGDDVCPNCESNLVLVETRRERTFICRECELVETEQRTDVPNAHLDGLAVAGVGAGAVAMLGPWFPTEFGVALIAIAAGGRLLARYRDEWQAALTERLAEVTR